MKADQADQQKVAAELATQDDKPTTPHRSAPPAVPYFCSQNPNVTLDEFFQRAG